MSPLEEPNERGHPVEAVQFVMYALQVAGEDPMLRRQRHVDAAELCRVLLELSVDEFGDDAPDQLRRWNLAASENVGRVVEGLLGGGLIHSDHFDTPSDFERLYDVDCPPSDWRLKW